MRDTELYRHLLGIESPWAVERVELDVKGQQVNVWVAHPEGVRWTCPECGIELPGYDHAAERTWRHLDSCQFRTLLHARPPRIDCPEHGVKTVRLPWAEPSSRFTAMFERLVIDVLHETDVSGAARILRMSWDEVWAVAERAVARGLERKRRRPIPFIGVDEKAAAKGHTYLTVVCDLDRATVEYVGDDRKKESLDGYFESLTPAQRTAVRGIALDMWPPYVSSIESNFAERASWLMVFDRFHIMQHLSRAIDAVRKQEHRALRADGDDTLLRTKYLWLHAHENLSDERRIQLNGLLRRADLKTGRAWALKEAIRRLWSYRSRAWADKHWQRWYFWATHSRLAPMIKAARTLKAHLANVMTFFTHRITNAVAEGINSKIQTIKQMACGYRNRDNFRTAILFHCGGLSLYPTAATH